MTLIFDGEFSDILNVEKFGDDVCTQLTDYVTNKLKRSISKDVCHVKSITKYNSVKVELVLIDASILDIMDGLYNLATLNDNVDHYGMQQSLKMTSGSTVFQLQQFWDYNPGWAGAGRSRNFRFGEICDLCGSSTGAVAEDLIKRALGDTTGHFQIGVEQDALFGFKLNIFPDSQGGSVETGNVGRRLSAKDNTGALQALWNIATPKHTLELEDSTHDGQRSNTPKAIEGATQTILGQSETTKLETLDDMPKAVEVTTQTTLGRVETGLTTKLKMLDDMAIADNNSLPIENPDKIEPATKNAQEERMHSADVGTRDYTDVPIASVDPLREHSSHQDVAHQRTKTHKNVDSKNVGSKVHVIFATLLVICILYIVYSMCYRKRSKIIAS